MTSFRASNCFSVTEYDDGQIGLAKPTPASEFEYRLWLRPDEAKALREYFASEACK